MTDLARIVELAALLLGAAGTVFLFFGTYGLEPPFSAHWADDVIDAEIEKRNRKRKYVQRAGLFFLLVSFLMQAAALYL